MAVFEQPPQGESEELREFLTRVNQQIGYELTNTDQVTRYTAIPAKLSIGKQYYFLNAIPADLVITAEGLYVYKSTGWVFLG